MRIDGRRVEFVEPIFIGERIRDLIQMQNGVILLWTDAAHFVELKVNPDEYVWERRLRAEMTPSEIEAGLEGVVTYCRRCHMLRQGSSDATSVSLWGVYGRRIASTDFEGYSPALRGRRGSWTEKNLQSFLSNPEGFASGTFMPDPAISDSATMQALVGYLKRLR